MLRIAIDEAEAVAGIPPLDVMGGVKRACLSWYSPYAPVSRETAMKTVDVNKQIQAALDRLIADLEKGKSESLTAYLATMSRFHRYSWSNVLLILTQCPVATHVAGFRAWNRFNRFVRRGEKGIVILAPMVFHMAMEKTPFEGGTQYAPAQRRQAVRFKAVHVFDISQTEGEPLPEVPRITGEPAEHLEALRDHVQEEGIKLVYADDLGGAEGLSEGGCIRIRTGLPAAEEFSVLVHELAHEKLHRGQNRKSLAKRVRELEAEAVACVVCHAIGLEVGTASSDYIQLYGGSKDALTASLARVQGTASKIIMALSWARPVSDAMPAEVADMVGAGLPSRADKNI